MSKVKLNLMAAAGDKMGIGINGTLPWNLKKEFAYFVAMTTNVKDISKQNAVIMGRVTWDSVPPKHRPLKDRLNIIITRSVEKISKTVQNDVKVVGSLEEAVKHIEARNDIENTWVIGGAYIYKAAMDHPNCDKIYLTEIQKTFDCDTFFPEIDKQKYQRINEDNVPNELQTEGDLSYYFRVYKKVSQ